MLLHFYDNVHEPNFGLIEFGRRNRAAVFVPGKNCLLGVTLFVFRTCDPSNNSYVCRYSEFKIQSEARGKELRLIFTPAHPIGDETPISVCFTHGLVRTYSLSRE
jgi:hypothetical protein